MPIDRVGLHTLRDVAQPERGRSFLRWRLHADGAISVGVIVTRGLSLHARMRELVGRFFDERQIQTFDDLKQWGYDPTSKQRNAIRRAIQDRLVDEVRSEIADTLVDRISDQSRASTGAAGLQSPAQ